MEIKDKIIESTIEIFSTMVMMEISVDDANVKDRGRLHDTLHDTITGMIGLAGTHKGVLAIHIPYLVAMAITSNFLGMDVSEINADVEDAVGELANMLGGNVKTILTGNGRDIDLSLPSTISGASYHFQPSKDVDKVVVQFGTASGPFLVELQLEK